MARGSGTSIQDVNTLLKQFKEMQKMMKGMASGNMPNIPGMPNMAGMSGTGRPEAGQAGRPAGLPGLRAGQVGADFDMLSQLMGDAGELPAGVPRAARAGPAPRPVVSGNKGTKKKKKGGRVTPPKGR